MLGCGYLGERVARFWRDAGDEVHATTRGDKADALSRAGLRPLKMDVTHGPALGPLPVVDTVVFAVGRDRRSSATMLGIHVTGLRSLLDALPEFHGLRDLCVARPVPQGPDVCLLEDTIDYELPLGLVGRLLGQSFMQRKPRRLFAYRHAVTRQAFE